MKILFFTFILIIGVSIISLGQTNTFPASGSAGIATTAPTHSLTFGYTATGIASYGTSDQTTNYVRTTQSWQSGNFEIGSFYGGTGTTLGNIRIGNNTGTGTGTVSRYFAVNRPVVGTPIFDFVGGTISYSSGAYNNIGNFTTNAAAGSYAIAAINPTISQSSGAGYRALWISPYESTTGSGGHYLVDAGTNSAANGGGTHTSLFTVDHVGNGYFAGNVGIGTANPQTDLHIVGTGSSIDGGNATDFYGGGLIVQGNTGSRSTTTGAQIEFAIPANTDGTNIWGQARIVTVAGNPNSGDATGQMILGTRRMFNKLGTGSQWYYGNDITIDGLGCVGINTVITKGYQLAVNGSAIATSMTVKLYGSWPDYVFKPSYALPSLSDVETYIDKNHHLPEIPSEQQIVKDGLNLGEMNKLLLKKVEELTLYVIEQNKKIEQIEAELKKSLQKP